MENAHTSLLLLPVSAVVIDPTPPNPGSGLRTCNALAFFCLGYTCISCWNVMVAIAKGEAGAEAGAASGVAPSLASIVLRFNTSMGEEVKLRKVRAVPRKTRVGAVCRASMTPCLKRSVTLRCNFIHPRTAPPASPPLRHCSYCCGLPTLRTSVRRLALPATALRRSCRQSPLFRL